MAFEVNSVSLWLIEKGTTKARRAPREGFFVVLVSLWLIIRQKGGGEQEGGELAHGR